MFDGKFRAPVDKAVKPLGEACPYCQLQADHPALLPLAALSGLLPWTSAEQPAAFLQAPRLLPIWRRALTRGPPLRA